MQKLATPTWKILITEMTNGYRPDRQFQLNADSRRWSTQAWIHSGCEGRTYLSVELCAFILQVTSSPLADRARTFLKETKCESCGKQIPVIVEW